MQFPIHVYKCPGNYEGPVGLSYKVKTADDSDHHAELISHGWFATLDDAIEAAGELAYPKPKVSAWRLLKKQKKLAKGKKANPATPKVNMELKQVDVIQADDNAPPTRPELETKAKELGISFDGRTTDRKLGERIAEALKTG
jgi:hypothetical protein